MKKLFPVLAVAYCLAFASCKKDYTCTCTLDTRQQNHAYSSSTVVFPYTDLTSGQARKKCTAEAVHFNATTSVDYMHDCGL